MSKRSSIRSLDGSLGKAVGKANIVDAFSTSNKTRRSTNKYAHELQDLTNHYNQERANTEIRLSLEEKNMKKEFKRIQETKERNEKEKEKEKQMAKEETQSTATRDSPYYLGNNSIEDISEVIRRASNLDTDLGSRIFSEVGSCLLDSPEDRSGRSDSPTASIKTKSTRRGRYDNVHDHRQGCELWAKEVGEFGVAHLEPEVRDELTYDIYQHTEEEIARVNLPHRSSISQDNKTQVSSPTTASSPTRASSPTQASSPPLSEKKRKSLTSDYSYTNFLHEGKMATGTHTFHDHQPKETSHWHSSPKRPRNDWRKTYIKDVVHDPIHPTKKKKPVYKEHAREPELDVEKKVGQDTRESLKRDLDPADLSMLTERVNRLDKHTPIDPTGALFCRYLRLSEKNITDLVDRVKEQTGEELVFHPNMKVQDVLDYYDKLTKEETEIQERERLAEQGRMFMNNLSKQDLTSLINLARHSKQDLPSLLNLALRDHQKRESILKSRNDLPKTDASSPKGTRKTSDADKQHPEPPKPWVRRDSTKPKPTISPKGGPTRSSISPPVPGMPGATRLQHHQQQRKSMTPSAFRKRTDAQSRGSV